MTAWDDTFADLHGANDGLFSIRIDTDTTEPEAATPIKAPPTWFRP